MFITPSITLFKKDQKLFNNDNWLNFLEVDINDLIKKNKIVFLDITADWCATCQFNKINVIEKKDINFMDYPKKWEKIEQKVKIKKITIL